MERGRERGGEVYSEQMTIGHVTVTVALAVAMPVPHRQ
jgi:hypothetical protein